MPAAPPFLLAFGDSLIAGYGLAPADGLSAQLQRGLARRFPGARVHNAGASGNTTADALRRLPRVLADAGLLERAVANVVANAVRYNPDPLVPVLVAASAHGDSVQLRVADRGPGVSDEGKQRMFEAFQRLGDAPQGTGVGLGLAVARGFVEAMHGTLDPEDTPGGGLTMVFTLRATEPDKTDIGGERGTDAGPGR